MMKRGPSVQGVLNQQILLAKPFCSMFTDTTSSIVLTREP